MLKLMTLNQKALKSIRLVQNRSKRINCSQLLISNAKWSDIVNIQSKDIKMYLNRSKQIKTNKLDLIP